MILSDLLVYCKVKALENLFNPTEESIYHTFCRTYSKQFHTPLHLVYEMDPEVVLQAIFDDKYEETDTFEEVEGILEDLYRLENPDYDKAHKINMDVFIKNMGEREKKRLAAVKIQEEKNKTKLRPGLSGKKSGSVDFSNLKNER